MHRSEFLRCTLLAGLGLGLLPWSLHAAPQMKHHKVVIVGAGAAGLYAGFLLHQLGIPFVILEASGQIGGRLGQVIDFADYPLDTGAQWLHGRNSLVGRLIQQTKAHITKDDSSPHYWFDGKIHEALPRNLERLLLRSGLPDISFLAYAKQQRVSDKYRYIIEALAGDYGADASQLSARWVNQEEEEWSSGENDYKFQQTYFQLLAEHIAKPIGEHIRLHTVVQSVDYTKKTIVLTDQHNNKVMADSVILTVPITMLQRKTIAFVPPLSADKQAAFDKIGMGPGMKVFLRFRQKFYHQALLGGVVCAAYLDESVGKAGKDHVLLAFVMGHQAQALSDLADKKAITKALLGELDTMYEGQASRYFVDSLVVDWRKHPYIGGAYSYAKVGIGKARTVAAAAIEKRIFFCGEAMNLQGHHQTVHGAMERSESVVRSLVGLHK